MRKGAIVDRVPLITGLPTSIRLSADKKKIYVSTNDHSGIEIVDVATHKVLNHFVLNTPTKHYRFKSGGVAGSRWQVVLHHLHGDGQAGRSL